MTNKKFNDSRTLADKPTDSDRLTQARHDPTIAELRQLDCLSGPTRSVFRFQPVDKPQR